MNRNECRNRLWPPVHRRTRRARFFGRSHSDVGEVTGYDSTEFFGEFLLELKAQVGRAAERVGQLVQDGPGEVREGLELTAA